MLVKHSAVMVVQPSTGFVISRLHLMKLLSICKDGDDDGGDNNDGGGDGGGTEHHGADNDEWR